MRRLFLALAAMLLMTVSAAAAAPVPLPPPSPAAPMPQLEIPADEPKRDRTANLLEQTPNEPAPAHTTGIPDAVVPRVIGDSQRAGLLVDAPEEPQKIKTYDGSVVWKTIMVSVGQGQPLSNAVSADIDIPDAKMALSILVKKSYKLQVPAMYTVEFHFAERPGNTLGPVTQIKAPQMRLDDKASWGNELIGVPMTVATDQFLFRLTQGVADQANAALLSQRNWVDMPILFSSGKVAKITFEKGPTGQKIIDDAIASWK